MRQKYLADTHILIWALNHPKKLSRSVCHIIKNENLEVYYSLISLWEISIKYGLGKLDLCGHTPEEFLVELDNSFFTHAPVSNEIIASSYRLPHLHSDPFDRMLFWQAICEDLVLLSADPASNKYKARGLKVIH